MFIKDFVVSLRRDKSHAKTIIIDLQGKKVKDMLQEKAGNIAGLIWNALAANNSLSYKQIKKTTKLAEKDFNLGLGWLLRENKLTVSESGDEKDPYIYTLK